MLPERSNEASALSQNGAVAHQSLDIAKQDRLLPEVPLVSKGTEMRRPDHTPDVNLLKGLTFWLFS